MHGACYDRGTVPFFGYNIYDTVPFLGHNSSDAVPFFGHNKSDTVPCFGHNISDWRGSSIDELPISVGILLLIVLFTILPMIHLGSGIFHLAKAFSFPSKSVFGREVQSSSE